MIISDFQTAVWSHDCWGDSSSDQNEQRGNLLILLYLINIRWLNVDFDWSRAGHAEGAILSCRMIISPSDVISA